MGAKNLKTVLTIIKSQKVNMGGAVLDQPLPSKAVKTLDPFVLIHHFKGHTKAGRLQEEEGVAPHPHRGFSPVTFIYKGENVHRDSMGNKHVLKEGGTQWLFSGSGLLHSERPSKAFAKSGGLSEGIQLWINAPSKYKMTMPFYAPLTAQDTPLVSNKDSKIAVVSGQFQGVQGPTKTQSPMTILRGALDQNGEIEFRLPNNYNTLIYLLDGALTVNGRIAKAKNMIIFKNDGDKIGLKAAEDTRYIVLSGEPIGEPIVAQGPFVMNTKQEIMQAYQDAKNGTMGYLIEDY
jgi:redox-sensitive bicupin YhaK (pirin superfamily)